MPRRIEARDPNWITTRRHELLSEAIKDTIKWCCSHSSFPEQKKNGQDDKRKRSDQHWVNVFSAGSNVPIDDKVFNEFFRGFQLVHCKWDVTETCAIIEQFRDSPVIDPVADILSFGQLLQGVNSNQARQTSAASKIAFLGRPQIEIFIWDSLAQRSARVRDYLRGGETGVLKIDDQFKDANNNHDYGAYCASCRVALADEKDQDDFMAGCDAIEKFLDGTDGPMADRSRVPRDFIERRLLDKLMYWEGDMFKKARMAEKRPQD